MKRRAAPIVSKPTKPIPSPSATRGSRANDFVRARRTISRSARGSFSASSQIIGRRSRTHAAAISTGSASAIAFPKARTVSGGTPETQRGSIRAPDPSTRATLIRSTPM